jgi:hypothetical protein
LAIDPSYAPAAAMIGDLCLMAQWVQGWDPGFEAERADAVHLPRQTKRLWRVIETPGRRKSKAAAGMARMAFISGSTSTICTPGFTAGRQWHENFTLGVRLMRRDHVVTLLKQHEPEFRDAGVGALFLFGSVARDEAADTSDIDVFFDLERPQGFTLFDLVALQERMQEILGAKVDLMTRQGMHPRRRPQIEAASVRVF